MFRPPFSRLARASISAKSCDVGPAMDSKADITNCQSNRHKLTSRHVEYVIG